MWITGSISGCPQYLKLESKAVQRLVRIGLIYKEDEEDIGKPKITGCGFFRLTDYWLKKQFMYWYAKSLSQRWCD